MNEIESKIVRAFNEGRATAEVNSDGTYEVTILPPKTVGERMAEEVLSLNACSRSLWFHGESGGMLTGGVSFDEVVLPYARKYIAAAIDNAVADEREVIALMADESARQNTSSSALPKLARAIRARGTKEGT